MSPAYNSKAFRIHATTYYCWCWRDMHDERDRDFGHQLQQMEPPSWIPDSYTCPCFVRFWLYSQTGDFERLWISQSARHDNPNNAGDGMIEIRRHCKTITLACVTSSPVLSSVSTLSELPTPLLLLSDCTTVVVSQILQTIQLTNLLHHAYLLR